MARNIFRTAFIGMMAVAGLMLLFFVLKVLLFFLIVGFLARFAMRHFRNKQMGQFQPAWAGGNRDMSGQPVAEPLFSRAWQNPYYSGHGAADFGKSAPVVEITRF